MHGDGAPAERLFDLPGLDAAGGLAAVGGNAAVYLRLLRMFLDKHAGDGPQILHLLAEGDRAQAAARAHRLRGAAATLGLVEVEAAAKALGEALRMLPATAGAASAPAHEVAHEVAHGAAPELAARAPAGAVDPAGAGLTAARHGAQQLAQSLERLLPRLADALSR